jgi:hypothetical protein
MVFMEKSLGSDATCRCGKRCVNGFDSVDGGAVWIPRLGAGAADYSRTMQEKKSPRPASKHRKYNKNKYL